MGSAKIFFYGGAGEVTGANFLLDTGEIKILVDCGSRERERLTADPNYDPFPYNPKTIDTLCITHAHMDHIGRVPKLVRDGFAGQIHSTSATKDLATLMFDDAIKVMAQESRGNPLYERSDVERALSLWQGHDYHESFALSDSVAAEFHDAGHILGSSMVQVTREGKRILFTGDLGNSPDPLLNDTEAPSGAEYIVMESVYGDRTHETNADAKEGLRAAIEEARARGGTLLIPSFSLERTQTILYDMNDLVESGSMQSIPVYLDAPLAIRLSEVYRKHASFLNPAARERFSKEDPFSFRGLHVTLHHEDSEEIYHAPNPKVIIAGAGMSHGGRIREHEKHFLGEKNAMILFVGYQAPGTLGRRIQDGEKRVDIDGASIHVKAHVDALTGFSGHKDRDGLLAFVESAGEDLKKVFVVMGEPKSSMFLAQRIRDFLGIETSVPQRGESVEIEW